MNWIVKQVTAILRFPFVGVDEFWLHFIVNTRNKKSMRSCIRIAAQNRNKKIDIAISQRTDNGFIDYDKTRLYFHIKSITLSQIIGEVYLVSSTNNIKTADNSIVNLKFRYNQCTIKSQKRLFLIDEIINKKFSYNILAWSDIDKNYYDEFSQRDLNKSREIVKTLNSTNISGIAYLINVQIGIYKNNLGRYPSSALDALIEIDRLWNLTNEEKTGCLLSEFEYLKIKSTKPHLYLRAAEEAILSDKRESALNAIENVEFLKSEFNSFQVQKYYELRGIFHQKFSTKSQSHDIEEAAFWFAKRLKSIPKLNKKMAVTYVRRWCRVPSEKNLAIKILDYAGGWHDDQLEKDVDPPSKPVFSYLFFDIETTGLPQDHNADYKQESNWPDIVQLAWIITDKVGRTIKERDFIIKPNGYTIPKASTKIHGISHESAVANGRNLNRVLDKFVEDFQSANLVIAHNLNFDKNVLFSKLWKKGVDGESISPKTLCTMVSTTNILKLPGKYGTYKWPKLEELHFHLFSETFNNAHNALADVRATAKCFLELKKRKLIEIPTLNSKNLNTNAVYLARTTMNTGISDECYQKGLITLAEQNNCQPDQVRRLLRSELDSNEYDQNKQALLLLIKGLKEANETFRQFHKSTDESCGGRVLLAIYEEYLREKY